MPDRKILFFLKKKKKSKKICEHFWYCLCSSALFLLSCMLNSTVLLLLCHTTGLDLYLFSFFHLLYVFTTGSRTRQIRCEHYYRLDYKQQNNMCFLCWETRSHSLKASERWFPVTLTKGSFRIFQLLYVGVFGLK